jgi:predicted phosphodiesterase
MRKVVKWLGIVAIVIAVLLAGLALYGAYRRWDIARPHARGPYLQSVTPDSVWVVWDTTRPVMGQVEYGLTPDLGQVARSDVNGLHHAVQLTGLQPYTLYHYRVDQGTLATFRTAATPDQTAFRFVVYGDTRSGGLRHRALVRRINQVAPDFLVHTGDLVEAGSAKSEWDGFFHVEAPLLRSAPFYPTLGNHEDYDPALYDSDYLDVFHLPGNELWYAFDYGHARFLCLKADGYPVGVYYPQGEQLAWLEGQLAANEAPWLLVFFHVGVYTSRSEDVLELGMRERLVPLFEQYGVDAVFMGHHHSYERLEVNGITYIVTAGGGAPLYELGAPEPGSQAAARAYHFVQIDVDGDRLRGQAIDRRGHIIDAFELDAAP